VLLHDDRAGERPVAAVALVGNEAVVAEDQTFGGGLRRGGELEAAGSGAERHDRERSRSELAAAARGTRGSSPPPRGGQLGLGPQSHQEQSSAAEALGIEQRGVEEAAGEITLTQESGDGPARGAIHRAGGATQLAAPLENPQHQDACTARANVSAL